jgi:hypothetical protein
MKICPTEFSKKTKHCTHLEEEKNLNTFLHKKYGVGGLYSPRKTKKQKTISPTAIKENKKIPKSFSIV